MNRTGRPNQYVEILKSLGGVGTAEDIFLAGHGSRRIKGSMLSCRQSLRGHLLSGDIVGNLNGLLRLPTAEDKAQGVRPIVSKRISQTIEQAGRILLLEVKMEDQYNEIISRLIEAEAKLKELESKLSEK